MMKFLNSIKNKQQGEIATLLTLLSVGLMAVGIFAGNKLAQTGGRLNPQAAEAIKCGIGAQGPGTWNWDDAFSRANGDLTKICDLLNPKTTFCTENKPYCVCNKWSTEWGCFLLSNNCPIYDGNIDGCVRTGSLGCAWYSTCDKCRKKGTDVKDVCPLPPTEVPTKPPAAGPTTPPEATTAPGQPTKPPTTSAPGAPTSPPAGGGSCSLQATEYGKCGPEYEGKCWQRTIVDGKRCSTDPGNEKYDKDCNKFFKCESVWKGPCEDQATCEKGAAPTIKPTTKPPGGGGGGPIVVPVTPPTGKAPNGYIVINNLLRSQNIYSKIFITVEDIQTMESTPISASDIFIYSGASGLTKDVLSGKYQYIIDTKKGDLPIVLKLKIDITSESKLKALAKIVYPDNTFVFTQLKNIPVCFPQKSPTPFPSSSESALLIYETCKQQNRVYTDTPPIDLDTLKPYGTPIPPGGPAPAGAQIGYYPFIVSLTDYSTTSGNNMFQFDYIRNISRYIRTDGYPMGFQVSFTNWGPNKFNMVKNISAGGTNVYNSDIFVMSSDSPVINNDIIYPLIQTIQAKPPSDVFQTIKVEQTREDIAPCFLNQSLPADYDAVINLINSQCPGKIKTQSLKINGPFVTLVPPTAGPTKVGGPTAIPTAGPTEKPESKVKITVNQISVDIPRFLNGMNMGEKLTLDIAGISYQPKNSIRPHEWPRIVTTQTQSATPRNPDFSATNEIEIYAKDIENSINKGISMYAWIRAEETGTTPLKNYCQKSGEAVIYPKKQDDNSLVIDKISFVLNTKNWLENLCSEQNIPTKSDLGLTAALTGSTNDDYERVRKLYTKGEIGPLEVSAFVTQVVRNPGLQKKYLDYSELPQTYDL